jgi:hypothetical protein
MSITPFTKLDPSGDFLKFGIHVALRNLENRIKGLQLADIEGITLSSIAKNENITHDGFGNIIIECALLSEEFTLTGDVPLSFRNRLGLFEYTEDGTNWHRVGSKLGSTLELNGNVPLYFRNHNGIFEISNDQVTWLPVGSEPGSTITLDDGATLLSLRNNGGVFESSADGITWQPVGIDIPSDAQDITIGGGLTAQRYQGMSALVIADATANPLLINVPDDGYWRSATAKEFEALLTFYDAGNELLVITVESDTGTMTREVERQNSLTWQERQVSFADTDILLLLQSDTFDGDTTVSDSSQYLQDIATTNVAHSTAQAKIGASSLLVSEHLTATLNTPVVFEGYVAFWVNYSGQGQSVYLNTASGSYGLFLYTDSCSLPIPGAGLHYTGIGLATGVWHHTALQIQGTDFKWFHNGSLVYTRSLVLPNDPIQTLTIGTYGFVGHIDELVLKKNAFFPDTGFTPQTTKTLLAKPILNQGVSGADLKIETANNSPLAISSMKITSENNAEIILNAEDFNA